MRPTSRSRRLLARTPVVRRVLRNPLVDAEWYRSTYEDVRRSGTNPHTHYALFGWREARNPNPLFDTEWYLAHYTDVRDSGDNPLDHYLLHGAYEGRDPGPYFDSEWYLDENPDVRASGLNPLLHYLAYGHGEGRKPRAFVDSDQPQPSTGIRPRGVAWVALTTWQRRRNAAATRSVTERRQPVVSRSELVRLFDDLDAAGVPDGAKVAVPWASIDVGPPASFEWIPYPAPGGNARPALVSATGAIAQLEWQRHDAMTHLAIPDSAQPWLDGLPGLRMHLDRYARLAGLDDSEAYDLRQPIEPSSTVFSMLRALVAEFHDRELRDPAVLDLWSGYDFTRALPGIQVFVPPVRQRAPFAYADSSVDFVGYDAADEEARVEARRIAKSGVLAVAVDRISRAWVVHVESTSAGRPSVLATVSIVIPTHNGIELVRRCLDGIATSVPAYFDWEAVVVDDCSNEQARAALAQVVAQQARARMVRSDKNLGYVGATNLGAETASGSLIVLLNDDTLPLPGWLSALARTLRLRPDAGAVGARLVYPDGRLQEAGGVIFSDASGANFGRHAVDPDAPEFSYLREVDYASGAALITPAEVFRSLGGLDPIYGFGYYEDADYAFRLRREGLKTLYQPHSVVVHIEGATAGTDTTAGPKSFQVTNRAVFLNRFAQELAGQPPAPERATAAELTPIADRAGR